jgi:hypothetical protein
LFGSGTALDLSFAAEKLRAFGCRAVRGTLKAARPAERPQNNSSIERARLAGLGSAGRLDIFLWSPSVGGVEMSGARIAKEVGMGNPAEKRSGAPLM